MVTETEKINAIAEQMDKISPTFCLAKWHHTTIYLHTGQTHSCYHPAPHNISLDEIAVNPSALHNTMIKKAERAEMLRGEKCIGCKYCWNVEALGKDHISDRMIRNKSIYRPERLEEILNNPPDFNINPEYVEIAFSNECNFKCGYCHPMASSSYHAEIKKFGPYNTVKNHALDVDWFKPIEEDENPYIKAWWEWWPELSKTLNILRITGGEPLMHRSTWKLLDMLENEPRQHLELNLNSNLGVSSRIVDKFAKQVNRLKEEKKIRKFRLYTSIDSWGDRAEYMRTGLDVNLWEQNMLNYINTTGSDIVFMCTFNILSVTSFTSLLEKILEWRKLTQQPGDTDRRIKFDTPYLKEPLQYDMHILPKEEYLPYFDKILKFIEDNKDENDFTKFSELEYQTFRRVRNYFASVNYDERRIESGRKDFYNWFTEYDRRRNVNLLQTFPEMEPFWKLCKEINDQQ